MSDIRFNTWLHQSGTGGISQVDGGHVGIGTTNPDIAVHSANAKKLNVGIVTANSIYAGNFYGSGSNLTGVGHVDKIIEGDTKVEVFDAGSQYISAEVNGSEKVRIDSSGRLLIGDTDTNNAFSGGDDLVIGNTDSGSRSGITIVSNSAQDGALYFSKGTSTDQVRGQIVYQHDSNGGYMRFYTNADERLRIHSSGQISINSGNTPEAQVDIYQSGQSSTTLSMLIGANEGGAGGQGRTNSNAKAARIGCPHYTNAEESMNILVAYSGATTNNLYWGGGTGVMNGATSHHFYTAANNTTTGGTERIRVLSNGHVAIGDDIANDTGMFKVIAANGQSDDQYVGQFKNLEATANRNWGLLVQAGSSSTDESLRVRNYANNRDHLLIRGDGVKVTQSRGGNYAKTFEFNYNDGAPGSQQTVSLATISTYNDVTSAVAEVTYVGVYGTANNYISSSKWICAVRRGSNNSVWSATAAESTVGGNTNTSSLDIYWNNGQLYAQTVGPWMGWTVNVRLTILNGDITVNV